MTDDLYYIKKYFVPTTKSLEVKDRIFWVKNSVAL